MTYTTKGSVRGQCAHKHRTLSGAVRCLKDDRRGCERQGGYSDRDVVRCDGADLSESDHYATDHLLGGGNL